MNEHAEYHVGEQFTEGCSPGSGRVTGGTEGFQTPVSSFFVKPGCFYYLKTILLL